jgi:hypothetical protein
MNRRDGFMKAGVVKTLVAGGAVTVALSLSAVSLAGVRTTQTTVPSRFVQMTVIIRDTGILAGYASGSQSHDNNYPLYGPVPRGDTLTINIRNIGKKVHNFEIAGRKTKLIKPGKTAHILIRAVVRGIYPWGSTIDKGKPFRGSLTVA